MVGTMIERDNTVFSLQVLLLQPNIRYLNTRYICKRVVISQRYLEVKREFTYCIREGHMILIHLPT